MPSCARKDIVDETVVGCYHCTTRCVRRSFLCGPDHESGHDFGHRKDWLEQRMKQMQQVFMLDLLGSSFLDNHLHLMLRNRPDLVEKMSDREVARRSLMLNTFRMLDVDTVPEPSKKAIDERVQDKELIAEWRKRLSSLSYYMKYLKEVISRRANAEDGVKGHFWEERFTSTRLLDHEAVQMCAMYVDLNEVRAQRAPTPEKSTRSSIAQRIERWRADRKQRKRETGKAAWASAKRSRKEAAPAWLSPIDDQSDNGTRSGTMTEEKPRKKAQRPSDSGFLPMSVEQYFLACDFMGRVARKDKRGAIPKNLAPIFARLTDDIDTLVDAVMNFGKLFKRCAGSPEAIRKHREAQGAQRIHGLKKAAEIYASSS